MLFRSELVTSCSKKLRAVVEHRVTDAASCTTTTGSSRFLKNDDVVTRLIQHASRRKTGQTSADDNDLHGGLRRGGGWSLSSVLQTFGALDEVKDDRVEG